MTEMHSKTEEFLKLRGVGKKIAEHFAKINIRTIEDLLLHLPYRYQDKTTLTPLAKLVAGQEALCEGEIQEVIIPARGRTKLLCELKDATGRLFVRFFHIQPFQKKVLQCGTRVRCFGEVRLGRLGLEMAHPEIQICQESDESLHQRLTPVYPATQGLKQNIIRKITQEAIKNMLDEHVLPELLPTHLLKNYNLPSLKEALDFIHHPPREVCKKALTEGKTDAQHRVAFEELLAHRLSLLHLKKIFQSYKSYPLKSREKTATFLSHLSFQLTNAQQKALNEIQRDLTQEKPMLRLLQGDVGSGKTVIAACALLQAIENGYQAAIMAPTEILAEQHFQTFQKWFAKLNLTVTLLSGSNTPAIRKANEIAIQQGEVQLIIGTHALFQSSINFKNLAMIVIDEQHRFGVAQRALLRQKGEQHNIYPHQLFMTATPIPRTLALSFYADLDCSIINELPPGRTPILTSVVPNQKRLTVIERIQAVCKNQRQVYWVCPLIEESESSSGQAAVKVAEELTNKLLDINVGLIHGRMRAKEKEEVMKLFQQGYLQILVATTVIEVGVDVPNASVMVIENAERLGLSQLHQLRGRVGRGQVASHCILLYEQPLTEIAQQRLAVMRTTADGFRIAEKDLELRGPGEVLGTRQTGSLFFRIADLMRDIHLLPQVQKSAEHILNLCPDIIPPLLERWFNQPFDDLTS